MADETQNTFVPPHDIEAEQAVLGAIFVDPDRMAEVTLILKHPSLFWRTSHQHIYNAILQLNAWGVDVSSGVETGGEKDDVKIHNFITAALDAQV